MGRGSNRDWGYASSDEDGNLTYTSYERNGSVNRYSDNGDGGIVIVIGIVKMITILEKMLIGAVQKAIALKIQQLEIFKEKVVVI